MKRNRDAIAQMAIYDLLCRMQENGGGCVIEQITGTSQDERCVKHESGWVLEQCKECIAAWLNEEAKS